MSRIANLLTLVPGGLPWPLRGESKALSGQLFVPGSDDSFVNAAVKGAIQRQLAPWNAGIHVSTSRGIVQLSGFVASRYAIALAVKVARAVSGVKSVKNDMRLV